MFLIKKIFSGKKQAAQESLQRLRGKTAEGVHDELAEMISVAETKTEKASISDLWKSKNNFKAMYLSCGLVAFQQLSGINVVLIYLETIFMKANTGLPAAISTIIIGVVQVIASSVTPFVVDRLGRRLLLLISGLGMSISLVS